MRATIDVRPGRGVVAGDIEAGALEVGLQDIGVARLLPRIGVTVVDALVADQGLQQLDGQGGVAVGH